MKKLYKNTLMQLIVALCTFGFVACQEYDIDSQPAGAPNIQIDAQDAYTALALSPNNITFNISANTPWNIECDAEWCHVSPAMSAASSLVSEIVVSIDDNDNITDPQDRTATLTITGTEISFTKTITITQWSREKLVVIPFDDNFMASADGEAVTLRFISNKPWEIIPSSEFVSNISPASGEGNDDGTTIEASITLPSNSGARRTGQLTVRTDFEEVVVDLTQDGVNIAPEDPAILEGISAGGSGGSLAIPITANVEWQYEVPEEYADWITVEREENTLNLSVGTSNLLAYTDGQDRYLGFTRTGYINLTPVEDVPGFEPIQIPVVQTGAAHGIYWQSPFPADITVNEAEQTVTVRASAQNRWSWDWNAHFNTGKLTFTFDAVNLLEGGASLDFNFDTWNGQAVAGRGFWHLYIDPDNKGRLQAGSLADAHGPWTMYQDGVPYDGNVITFDLPIASNDLRTLVFEVIPEDNNGDSDWLVVTVAVNDQVALTVEVENIFKKYPESYWGQLLYFGFAGAGSVEGVISEATFRSLDWEVYDYGYWD